MFPCRISKLVFEERPRRTLQQPAGAEDLQNVYRSPVGIVILACVGGGGLRFGTRLLNRIKRLSSFRAMKSLDIFAVMRCPANHHVIQPFCVASVTP